MIGRPSITFRSTINVILIMSCIYVGLLIFCRFQWNPVFAQIASAYCCESRYANAGCDKLRWKANIANMNAAHRVQIPPYLPYLYIYKYVILFSPHDCVEHYICGEISVKYTCEIYVDFANLSIFMDLYCSTCAAITVAGFKWGVLVVFFFIYTFLFVGCCRKVNGLYSPSSLLQFWKSGRAFYDANKFRLLVSLGGNCCLHLFFGILCSRFKPNNKFNVSSAQYSWMVTTLLFTITEYM